MLHHPPVVELQAHPGDVVPHVRRVEAERDVPARAALDGARVDLAVGEVLVAVGVVPGAAGDVEHEVGVLGQDADLAHAREPLGDLRLARRLLAPERDRVGIVQVARAVDEVLPVGERHAGVLGGRVARERRPAPAHVAGRLAGEEALEQRAHRRRPRRLRLGRHAAHMARVRVRPDRENACRRLDLDLVELRDRGRLGVVRALEQGGVSAFEPRPEHRVGAGIGHHLDHLDEERLRQGRPVDQHRVARPDLERVAAEHLG